MLASALASTRDASEGFTLVLPGQAFQRSWGLVEGVKGKNEEVKEEYPSDEDGDLGIHDNLDDLGDPEGREDDSDELSPPSVKENPGKEDVNSSSK